MTDRYVDERYVRVLGMLTERIIRTYLAMMCNPDLTDEARHNITYFMRLHANIVP